ncbi:coiled-coil domain-containing protein 50 isoform X1 [Acyrthosiphon pisum]|uniref:Coiled-coil domain-containing protein n=1 Tax=Acyrthosiphon pisum TaxID=7029 RepID=A0A8R1VZW5_ACYPI|nr:coiled-coil domain-containing protein 50 isoform X1 [Acyrthosiphon pisum]|eukprot:XP_001945945.1 PREDICTED: coiled-coil domain-containing protein 50 isoform X1 [Acyrthosiphon pisum]
MHCQFGFGGVGSMGDNIRKKATSDTLPKPGKVNSVCKEWLVHEDGALAYHLQKLEVDEHYSGNRSRNAIVRQDLPTAKEEQEREIREAEERYGAFIKEQEEKDLKVAMELAEKLTKNKYTHDIGVTANSGGSRPGILKKHCQPESTKSFTVESNEYTEFDIDDILHDIDYEEEVNRRIQEQKDAELAKRLQEQEGRPMSIEDRDRLIAIETQDCELAKLLQEKEKARMRRAREKAKQKALLKKQQQLEESSEVVSTTQEPLSNIAIAIDPTYSSRRTELQDNFGGTSTALSSSLDDVPPYMPIQGQRRSNHTDKKKKSKTDGVASFFKVFK